MRISSKRERNIAKRRATAIDRALKYLKAGLEGLPHVRIGTSIFGERIIKGA